MGIITGLFSNTPMGLFMLVLAVLLPGIVTFLLKLKLERKVADHRPCLKVHHGLRITGFAFPGNVVLMAVFGAGHGSGDSGGTYLLHVLSVVASGVAGHFISRRPQAMVAWLRRLKPWRTRSP